MFILSAKLKTKYPRQCSLICKIYYVCIINTRVWVGVHGGQKRVQGTKLGSSAQAEDEPLLQPHSLIL